MLTLQDIVQAVQDEQTVEQSAIVLLETINDELKTALAANDQTAMQGVIDLIAAGKAKLAQAIIDNTPASTTTTTSTTTAAGPTT